MLKECERCKSIFSCRSFDIANCICRSIELNDRMKEILQIKYKDCLCLDCLLCLNKLDSKMEFRKK